ncbi:MAG: DHH family phosphoesterase [Clostridiales bacterium]|nr:DHH family phosphoesterase [Candidatus Blautia equi]
MDKDTKDRLKMNLRIRRYLRWPLYLTLLLILINIPVYYLNAKAGLLVSGGIVIYFIIAMLLSTRHRPLILNDLIEFASQYQHLERRMLQELNVPYAIMDQDGKMIWSNKGFGALTGKEPYYRKNVHTIFPEITRNLFPDGEEKQQAEIQLNYKGNSYSAYLQCLSVKDPGGVSDVLNQGDYKGNIITMYLWDNTELQRITRENEDNKLVVALAYLDNYEEATESVEEVRRSLLTALIDRKMTKFFAGYDCIVRKIEKDKYFLIMSQGKLAELKEQRFQILDEVKTVSIGNEIAVTLSIGVGLNSGSFLQNYEYSRSAMEMALGRGGDQVVIKDKNNLTCYGGKAQQVEKNTRVKARVKAQSLKELMSTQERILVMGHKISDVDALGAAIGIYRAGKTLGKQVHIVVNNPSTSIRPLIDGYLSHPDYEANMFVDGKQAKELVDQHTAVILVDTNKPSYTECPELLGMTRTVVVLDHHRRGNEVVENAVLSYVEPYASSACEMVAEILQYFDDNLKLKSNEADSLYAGILIDTNNFTTRAGVRTFEAAAFLRRCGADMSRVRKMLRDSLESYQARAEAVRTAEIYKKYFAISVCPSEGLESPTVVGAQAANELLNIQGVKASFVLTPYKNEIFISARAIDEVNVQLLMEKMGGGGHLNIAGAQVDGTMEEVKESLKGIIDELCMEGDLKK